MARVTSPLRAIARHCFLNGQLVQQCFDSLRSSQGQDGPTKRTIQGCYKSFRKGTTGMGRKQGDGRPPFREWLTKILVWRMRRFSTNWGLEEQRQIPFWRVGWDWGSWARDGCPMVLLRSKWRRVENFAKSCSTSTPTVVINTSKESWQEMSPGATITIRSRKCRAWSGCVPTSSARRGFVVRVPWRSNCSFFLITPVW